MNEEKYQAILKKLAEPFPPDCIEWRVQSATEKNGKIKLLILPYIESRAVMERFDEVCGVFWQSEFQQIKVNGVEAFQCRISVKVGNEWISRTDAAEVSDYESVKGGHSNALKRAGVQWGVGRYLYNLPLTWVEMKNRGKYPVYGSFKINGQTRQLNGYFDPPELPHWALPKGFSQKTQKDNQKPEQKASTNAGEEREKALNFIKQMVKELNIPTKFVNPLFEKASGKKQSIANASYSDLQKVYEVIYPVYVFVNCCKKYGLEKEEDILYYAQTVLQVPIESIHALYFKMTKEVAEQALKLIRQDLKLDEVV